MAAVFFIVFLVPRIFGGIYCSKKAIQLNRSAGGWAVFGITTPIVAIIWVNSVKKRISWSTEKNIKA